MANIKTYTAAPFSLTESDKGGQAFSQAGRRLGPLYNEAAQFTREAGKLAADNKAQLWPFDILELYQKNAANAAKGGSGFRTKSGGDRGGSAVSDFANERFPDLAAANGQISTGAAALGQALSDGGQAVSRKPTQDQRQAAAGAPVEDMVLQQGELVTASAARRAMQEYNSGITKEMDTYRNNAINSNDYWQQYNGSFQTDRRFDPSPIDIANAPAPASPDLSPGFGDIFTGAGAASIGRGIAQGAGQVIRDIQSTTGGVNDASTAGGF